MFKEANCKMEARTGIALVLLLMGCTQPQILDESPDSISDLPPTVVPKLIPQQREAPRRLKLRLTLDQPANLKVKVGDQVVEDQVIGRRSSTRNHVTRERQSLQLQLSQLQQQTIPRSTAVEEAELQAAKINVIEARKALTYYHADSPWTTYARQTLPLQENQALGQLQQKYQQAKTALSLAKGRLKQTRQIELAKVNAATRRTELLQTIRALDAKLISIESVRSPYSGVIKSIKWLGQTDQELQVELTLSISASKP